MMTGPTPRLEIHTDRIAANLRSVVAQCAEHGVEVAVVTKVLRAHPALLAAIQGSGAAMVADSRLDNLARVRAAGLGLPTMLLRAPTPRVAAQTVELADISLNSSLTTLTALSDAARSLGIEHGVVLMVDVGDLREGVWPDEAVDLVVAASRLPGLRVLGMGTNLACYGGVIPTREKMQLLLDLRDEARRVTGLELGLVSGGNSANLPLMAAGGMPPGITNLRIGEAVILGRNTLDRSPWPGTRQDTVEVVAEVIELEHKPSVPIGDRGQDAFGRTATYVDRGVRWRAICNLGRQDADPATLDPLDPGHIVLGASSDHLIVDVTDGHRPLAVGDEIRFRPTYAGLLATTTCPDVWKTSVRDPGATGLDPSGDVDPTPQDG